MDRTVDNHTLCWMHILDWAESFQEFDQAYDVALAATVWAAAMDELSGDNQ